MTDGGKLLLCLVSGFLLCANAGAVVADPPGGTDSTDATSNETTDSVEPARTPYQPIVDRNVFGLKPPPPPAPPPEPKKEVSKIVLAGITTLGGSKKVMLKTQTPGKPGQPAQDQYYTLPEGQRDGEIEVVEIDEKNGIVKVKHSGNPVTLDFESNGNKPPVSAAPVAAIPGAPGTPGVVGSPGGIPAPSTGMPGSGTSVPAAPAPSLKPLPTRTLRAPSASIPAAGGGQGLTAQAPPPVQVPVTALNSPQSAAGSPSRHAQLSAEEQAILMEVEREQLRAKGDPAASLIPPTPLTPPMPPTPNPH
jgi:hypothetical protein